MTIVIKRYQNRKLYNTQSKRYITLEEIEELIKKEEDIIVIDNSTGRDITAITLSQIIFEFEKNSSGFLPIKLLLSLVQSGGNRIDELRHNFLDTLSLHHNYDLEIERRVHLLMELGELTQEAGTQILDKLISIGNEKDNSTDNIEDAIVGYIRDRQIPTKNDLQLLIQKIDSISEQVDQLQLEEKKLRKRKDQIIE
jgi:polyhydroxyalkanoate synthesis repressor PhaR